MKLWERALLALGVTLMAVGAWLCLLLFVIVVIGLFG